MKRSIPALAALAALASMTSGPDILTSTIDMPVPDFQKSRKGGQREHSHRHTGARKIQRAAKKKRNKR